MKTVTKPTSAPFANIARFAPQARRIGAAALLGAIVTTQLSACFPLAAAGIAVGTLAATDRRTLGAQADDKSISLRAESRIKERYGNRAHVNVNAYNRKVLLTGEVPDAAARVEVESIVASVENVLSTVNETVVAPITPMSARTNDALITGQVKAAFVDAKDLFANSIKVVTERNVVYLMGRVTQREGNRAGEITRTLRGVQKVVKVFDYITEQELASMQTQSAPSSSASR